MSITFPALPFSDAFLRGGLAADGAMGTQLYERGTLYSACFEELSASKPEVVARVHEDYLRAGAQVLGTNTFGANALRLERHGLSGRVTELNEKSVQVARSAVAQAAPGRGYVTGVIGPSGYFLGDASADDRAVVSTALLEQAKALVGAGVDAIVIETMRQMSELRIALDACLQASAGKVPVIACVSIDETLRTAESLLGSDVAVELRALGAFACGINCSDGPMTVLAGVTAMLPAGLPIWAKPNAGLPRRVDDRLVYISTPEYFGVYARRMFKLGVRIVGGCCGTTPEHIRRIAAAARMIGHDNGETDGDPGIGAAGPASSPAGFVTDGINDLVDHGISISSPPGAAGGGRAPVALVPFAERSTLARKLAAGQFAVSVEVNPPIGIQPHKAVAAARMLKAGGVDVINIADGARAQARMANLSMAARIEREVGIETILHVCGRDRNLLATLAHLLGAHDQGIRNLVVITGDPPKMGDFPDATAVYDLDSIGILKLAQRLNSGIDPAGKPLGGTTSFVLATGAEPAALNYKRELARLRLKQLAGAEVVMTQPVYDASVLEKFLDDIAPLNMKVLVGILPLASYRNAEFLHNEVPGMQVPEETRERMRKAGGGPEGRREGVAIARELLGAVRHRVAGAYVMPPLERYELALEVLDGFLDTTPELEPDAVPSAAPQA
jgi:methionine synthase / methylenetetrahydrofolate reductase(NADPH)